MIIVGLTGGMGSGKSLISKIFRTLGIPVFDADKEARILTDSDPGIREALLSWLSSAFFEDGILMRPKVAELVFSNPGALEKLNGIIHPVLRARFIGWASKQKDVPYVMHEAAILFESGFYSLMDANILVRCPEEIRIQRVARRDGISPAEVALRLGNQWTDERKTPLADFCLDNDGSTSVLPAVLSIHNQIIQLTHGKI